MRAQKLINMQFWKVKIFVRKNRKIETEEWELLYNLCIIIRLTYEKRSKTMKNDRFYVAKGFVSGCEMSFPRKS